MGRAAAEGPGLERGERGSMAAGRRGGEEDAAFRHRIVARVVGARAVGGIVLGDVTVGWPFRAGVSHDVAVAQDVIKKCGRTAEDLVRRLWILKS